MFRDALMSYMVMLDKVLHIDRFLDSLHLIQLARVRPHVWVVDDSLLVALE